MQAASRYRTVIRDGIATGWRRDILFNRSFVRIARFFTAVILRKNSDGNRNDHGADCQAVLMSLFRTLKQRGHDPIKTILSALQTHLQTHLQTGQLPPCQKNRLQTADVLRKAFFHHYCRATIEWFHDSECCVGPVRVAGEIVRQLSGFVRGGTERCDGRSPRSLSDPLHTPRTQLFDQQYHARVSEHAPLSRREELTNAHAELIRRCAEPGEVRFDESWQPIHEGDATQFTGECHRHRALSREGLLFVCAGAFEGLYDAVYDRVTIGKDRGALQPVS